MSKPNEQQSNRVTSVQQQLSEARTRIESWSKWAIYYHISRENLVLKRGQTLFSISRADPIHKLLKRAFQDIKTDSDKQALLCKTFTATHDPKAFDTLRNVSTTCTTPWDIQNFNKSITKLYPWHENCNSLRWYWDCCHDVKLYWHAYHFNQVYQLKRLVARIQTRVSNHCWYSRNPYFPSQWFEKDS